jgi:ABC-type lipoprotein export system ATPase subunit
VVGLLRFEGVSKRYSAGTREVVALDDVDLAIAEGEFVALVGKSGSGKSTLLHLAGGLDVADSGRVTFSDRDVGEMGIADRARMRRREVGFVFQFFHLIPTLTVRENVELPLMLDGAKAGDRAGELLERVGLAGRADHLPGELSGGEMQRAAVARALIARPRLLLADEPTGNLDSVTGADVLQVLRDEVAMAGAAMLMVTHDSDAAARADRVHRMVDGRLVAQGSEAPSSEAATPAPASPRPQPWTPAATPVGPSTPAPAPWAPRVLPDSVPSRVDDPAGDRPPG